MNFSIVIPLYNKSYSIERCIDSVLSQTYKNFKIIVVNDGSTDDSSSIINIRYSEEIKSGIMKIIEQCNQGVSVARNEGVKASQSDYICFLDADDEWKTDFLQEIHRLICDFPKASLYCLQHETKKGKDRPIISRSYYGSNFRGYVPNFFKASLFSSIANSSKICIKKEFLAIIGGFPEGYKSGEDLYVWMECSLHGSIAFYNRVSVRIHVANDSSREGRSESIPYPFIYYGSKPHINLSFWPKAYLFRIYLSHLFVSLRTKDIESAKTRTAAASVLFPSLKIIKTTLDLFK